MMLIPLFIIYFYYFDFIFMLLFILYTTNNYQKIVEKDFIYYYIIAIKWGGGIDSLSGEKRPGTGPVLPLATTSLDFTPPPPPILHTHPVSDYQWKANN